MAQDFQDLTGQVIKKVIEIVGRIETELLQILIEAIPEEARPKKAVEVSLMNGPVIDTRKTNPDYKVRTVVLQKHA